MDYSVKMTSKRRTTLLLLFVFVKNNIYTFWPWDWLLYDLELKLTLHMTLNNKDNTLNRFSSQNPMKKRYCTFFLALFGKTYIFSYLTLELTSWPWWWPWIIKIVSEMDCPGKITWEWGITLVPSFISWKIIFDLEIDLWPSIYKNARTFQAGTHRIWIQHKKIYKKHQKNIAYVTKQG